MPRRLIPLFDSLLSMLFLCATFVAAGSTSGDGRAFALISAKPVLTNAGQSPQPDSENRRFGVPDPLPRPAGSIRIATYNVENLFDHEDDPALSGEWDDKGRGISDARARAIADVIRRIDADIIALQEIESLAALKWFRDTYLPDAGYDHVASIDVGYYRGIECAVMSRFEIVSATAHGNAPLDDLERTGVGWSLLPRDAPARPTIQRAPLIARVRTPDGYEITIFSVHHKSGRQFQWHRELEALRIVQWVREEAAANPSRNIIVMGDFNGAPWDKSLRVYRAEGLVDVMSHRTVEGAEGRLYKTHRSDKVYDYILMNSAAYREFIPGSAHIVGTFNPPESWNWQTDPYPAGYAADHYPVIADLVSTNLK